MDLQNISEDLTISPQITTADIRSLTERGFRSIICNRPDGEAPDQPSFAEVEAAANAAGLETRYIPVEPGEPMEEATRDFRLALSEMSKPVLAYCRSGARSKTLWSRLQAERG